MTLLDVANYGLFHSAAGFMAFLGKLFLGSLAAFFGGIFLLVFAVVAAIAIVIFSVGKGAEHRSLLKATGTFFRLSGLAAGVVIGLVAVPVVLLLKASLFASLSVFAITVLAGFWVGFIISEIVALRLWKYEFYIRTFDNLRIKIQGIGND